MTSNSLTRYSLTHFEDHFWIADPNMCGSQYIWRILWSQILVAELFVYITSTRVDLYSHQILLTHWGRVRHICVSKITIIGSDNGLSPPSHYLNQCWDIVNLTLKNKLQWNIHWHSYISIQENAFENVVCEMSAILSRPQCVNTLVGERSGCYLKLVIFNPYHGYFLWNCSQVNATRSQRWLVNTSSGNGLVLSGT